MSGEPIVVALDGSDLAEGALPYATVFAKALDARLLLIIVWEAADDVLEASLRQNTDLFKKAEQQYEQYLASVAKKVKGVPVDAEVLHGHSVPDTIATLAEERHAQMLALASHGRSGIGRWAYGSVAASVIRRATVPTLVVGTHALERSPKEPTPKRIMVPLDGSDLAEQALEHALSYAKTFDAELLLVQAVGTAPMFFPFDAAGVTAVEVELELVKAAEEYLTETASSLSGKARVETRVFRGPAADVLLDAVESDGVDLVVMTTHGRSGFARLTLGSTADRMLQAAAPVLLVRAGGA